MPVVVRKTIAEEVFEFHAVGSIRFLFQVELEFLVQFCLLASRTALPYRIIS
jgi:hypothetical protein